MPVYEASEKDIYVLELRRVLRVAGLLMPFFVMFIGFAIKAGLFNDDYYYSDSIFYIISISFIIAGFWQYYTDVDSTNNSSSRLVLSVIYHALAVAFLLYISGFNSPVILLWLIVLVATDIYYGRKALMLSASVLLIALAIHILMYEPEVKAALESFVAAMIVIITGVIVSEVRVLNDIERRALNRTQKQESLQHDRLLTLINGIGDGFISTNQKGVIKVYNAATLSLLDTNESLTGRKLNDVLKLFDDNEKHVNILKLLEETNGVVTRTDLIHKFDDGEQINLYMNIAPIKPSFQQNTQHGYNMVIRDITKEKSLEEERDEFISVVSHELRTPVTVAEGNLSNLKLHVSKGSDKSTLSKAIDTAHEQIMYLAKMINDLSTLSRAERGIADEPEDINVRDLVHELYNKYLPQAQQKGLKLNLDASSQLGTVSASRLYLEETLQNFLTNAIKYTPEGSVILGAKLQGSEIEFSVTDSGIGMSKADQKHVFEKFFRSEDYRTRETSGTGLGLYIVRKLAHKLKIHIDFESRLNHGSRFSFKMPVK